MSKDKSSKGDKWKCMNCDALNDRKNVVCTKCYVARPNK